MLANVTTNSNKKRLKIEVDETSFFMRKQRQFVVEYQYIEPKTPQEKAEQQRRIDEAFDILFEATLRYMKKNKVKAKTY